MRKLVFLLGMMLMAFVVKAHDFHVSITKIDYNPQSGNLEITLRIFSDDLERALEHRSGEKIRLGSENEHKQCDQILQSYLVDKFHIRTDGEERKATFLGKQVEYDITWCYLEVEGSGAFTQIEVLQKLLTEVYDDQSNIVHVSLHGQKQSLVLNKNRSIGSLDF